ncbi:MAG TPA: hypothetical protein VMV18_12840 [bacterium]|nr:hypothetical protein [bacterium]
MRFGGWIVSGLAAATLAIGIAACDKKTAAPPHCPYVSAGSGATVQYSADPACSTNPFPSDVLRSGATLNIPAERLAYVMPPDATFDTARTYMGKILATMETDGFSPLAPIIIPMSHEIDPTTAAAGVKLFTVTTGASAAVTLDSAHTFSATWDPNFQALVLQPLLPLEEQTEYGVVVTADLKDTNQLPSVRAPAFELYVKGTPAPEITALLAGAGVPQDQVALAFTFRTQTIAHDLVAIRDQIFGATAVGSALQPAFTNPDPQLTGLDSGYFLRGTTGFDTNIGDANFVESDLPHIGAVATGAFDVWKFRDDKLLPFNPAYVADGSLGPKEHVQFRVAFPTGTMPAGGWPVVLYQHGLGGAAVDVYNIAEKANAVTGTGGNGYVVIGTEAVAHGRRGGIFEFFNWDNMASTRDNFRESVADDLQLLRMMRNAHDQGISPFDQLNVSDVTYMGISLGGILGGPFTALAPNVPESALVVPGGHLAEELTAPGVGQAYLWNYVSSRADINPLADEASFLIFVKGFEIAVQTALDGADGANFGVHVLTPGRQLGVEAKRVLIQESHGDTWVPNDENETLRRAMRLPIDTSATTDATNGVSGAWVYTTAAFPSLATDGEPHGWWSHLCNERVQTFTWVQSHGTDLIDPTTVTCSN